MCFPVPSDCMQTSEVCVCVGGGGGVFPHVSLSLLSRVCLLSVCLLCVCLSEGPKWEVRAKVAQILKSHRLGSSTIVCVCVYVCVCGGGGGGGYDSFDTSRTFNHQSHKTCSDACTLAIIRVND